MVEEAGTGGPLCSTSVLGTQYSVRRSLEFGAWTSARDKINVERDGTGVGRIPWGVRGAVGGYRDPSLRLFFALSAQRTIFTQDDNTKSRSFDCARRIALLSDPLRSG
jgi:hypothetical protein